MSVHMYKITHCRKILYQMVIKYIHIKTFQGPTKYVYQNWYNIYVQYGNPASLLLITKVNFL
jgi:hypothetical protein